MLNLKLINFKKWLKHSRTGLPLLITFSICTALFIYWNIFYQPPIVFSFEPKQAAPGDLIQINGLAFGENSSEARLLIGGRHIASSYIVNWTNSSISFHIPHNMNSGILSIENKNGIANSQLLINTDQSPTANSVQSINGEAFIEKISKNLIFPGEKVSIFGGGFGNSPHEISIFDGYRFDLKDAVSWTPDRIDLIIPYITKTYNLSAGSNTLISNAKASELSNIKSTKLLFEIEYNLADIVSKNDMEGHIRIFSPRPENNSNQRLTASKIKGDFVENSTSVYGMAIADKAINGTETALSSNFHYELSLISYDMAVNPDELPEFTFPSNYQPYVLASPYVPIQNQELKKIASQLSQSDENKFRIMLKTINFIISNIKLKQGKSFILAPEVLRDKEGSSFGISSLACALMRLNGIPARMVEGYLRTGNSQFKETIWMEMFITGLGWIPFSIEEANKEWTNTLNLGGKLISLLNEGNEPVLSRVDDNSARVNLYQFMEVYGEPIGGVESFGLNIRPPRFTIIQN